MSATVAAALRYAAARLAAASDTARLDAEVLMAHALGVPRGDMLLRHMAAPPAPGFAALVDRRVRHEPVAYITGHGEFYGLDLAVSPAVLIPRADSEALIDAARVALAERPPARILDLGTGSGALLLAALSLWPRAHGCGVERSLTALAVAKGNARRHAAAARLIVGDWAQPGWNAGLGTYDLIVCNPPYVETDAPLAPSVRDYEPGAALFAGTDGLDDYRILVPQLPALLTPGGIAIVEIGATQAEAVTALAAAATLAAVLRRDLAGRPRVLQLSAA